MFVVSAKYDGSRTEHSCPEDGEAVDHHCARLGAGAYVGGVVHGSASRGAVRTRVVGIILLISLRNGVEC